MDSKKRSKSKFRTSKAETKKIDTRQGLALEPLEPRTLFSVDFLALPPPVEENPLTTDEISIISDIFVTPGEDGRIEAADSIEYVFVNADLPDIDLLITSFEEQQQRDRNLEIVVLELNESGIEKITNSLETNQVSAIHILSHGSEQGLLIGSDWIDAQSINQYKDQLVQWSTNLTPEADLLLYGCDFSLTQSGIDLAQQLAELTTADVATSSDNTGHQSQGGDWDLENATGSIQTPTIANSKIVSDWQHILPTYNGTIGDDVIYDNTDVTVINFNNTAPSNFVAGPLNPLVATSTPAPGGGLALDLQGTTTHNDANPISAGTLLLTEIEPGIDHSIAFYVSTENSGQHDIAITMRNDVNTWHAVISQPLTAGEWMPVALPFTPSWWASSDLYIDFYKASSGNPTPYVASVSVVNQSSTDAMIVYADAGADLIITSFAGDYIEAGPGADTISTGDGSDTIDLRHDPAAGNNNNLVSAGAGDDTIYDGLGNSIIEGGEGNDKLLDGPGNDKLRGGPGNDGLFDEAGADNLGGGSGNDNFYLYEHDPTGTEINILHVGQGDDGYVLAQDVQSHFAFNGTDAGTDGIILGDVGVGGSNTYYLPNNLDLGEIELILNESGTTDELELTAIDPNSAVDWDFANLIHAEDHITIIGTNANDYFTTGFAGERYRGGTGNDRAYMQGDSSDYAVAAPDADGFRHFLHIASGTSAYLHTDIESIDFDNISSQTSTLNNSFDASNSGAIPSISVDANTRTNMDLSALQFIGGSINHNTDLEWTLQVSGGQLEVNDGTWITPGTPGMYTASINWVNYFLDISSPSPYDYTATDTSTTKEYLYITVNEPGSDLENLIAVIPIDVVVPPVLNAIESTAIEFTEDGPGIIITETLGIYDLNNTHLHSAEVRISTNHNPTEDSLTYQNNSGNPIYGQYNPASGILTLTPTSPATTATIEEFGTAIRSVVFNNTGEHLSPTDRTIEYVVNDGTSDSNIISRQINIIPNNDKPTIDPIEPTAATYAENDSGVSITQALNIDDPDNINIKGAVVTLDLRAPGDELIYTGNNATIIASTYDPANGQLKLDGPATIAEYETAIQSIEFRNTSDDPTDTLREVTIVVDDGNLYSNVVKRNIEVTPENDRPIIDTIESSDASFQEGDIPLQITQTLNIEDPDNTTIDRAIVTLDIRRAGDKLVYNGSNAVISPDPYDPSNGQLVLNGSASLADYETAIQSITFINGTDNPTEDTREVSFVVFDGDMYSNVESRNIAVTAINDKPSIDPLESTAAVYTENGTGVRITQALNIADADDTSIESAVVTLDLLAPGDELVYTGSNPLITPMPYDPATNQLKLNGSANIAEYEAAIQSIEFQNTTDDPTSAVREVSIVVYDGNLYSNVESRNINVTAINDKPIISASTENYTEQQNPASVAQAMTIADLDDTNIESATIVINNPVAGDELFYTGNSTDLSVSHNTTADGKLEFTLTGTADTSEYETALQSVFFRNTTDDPTNTLRSLSMWINDGDANSNYLLRAISVTPVNDEPALTAIENSAVLFAEGDLAVQITQTLDIGDLDDTNIEAATFTLTNRHSADILVYDGSNPTISASTYNPINGVLTLSGPAPISDYEQAIQYISFHNSSDNPGAATRNVAIIVNDGSLDSQPIDRDIYVTPVNDKPTLSNIGTGAVSFTEGGVSAFITQSPDISDLDDTHIDRATITLNNRVGDDILVYNGSNSVIAASNYDPLTGNLILTGSATLAQYEQAIQSISFENTSNDPTNAIRNVSIFVSDGNIDSDVIDRDIYVTPINDQPTLSAIGSSPVSFTEGDAAIEISQTLSVTDPDNINIESATATLTNGVSGDVLIYSGSNPAISVSNYDSVSGQLILSGTAPIAEYEVAIRSIKFQSTSDNPTNTTRNVAITVNDGNLDSAPKYRDINVRPVNDEPTLSAIGTGAASFTEGDPSTIITQSLNISDPDDTNIDSATITINNRMSGDVLIYNGSFPPIVASSFDPSNGTITLSGSAAITEYETAIRSIEFYNPSDDPRNATRNISIVVNDGNIDSFSIDRDVKVNPINDTPTISSLGTNDIIFTEGDVPIAVTTALNVSDVDDNNIESATLSIVNFKAGEDTLTMSPQPNVTAIYDLGVMTLTGPATTTEFQDAIRAVYYSNSSENPNTTTRTLNVVVNDGEADSNVMSRDIKVVAINDNPILAALDTTPIAFNEGDLLVMLSTGITVTDVDDINIETASITISNYVADEDMLTMVPQTNINAVFSAGTLTLTGSATTAEYQQAIRAVSYVNNSEDPDITTRTITFTVSDGDIDSNSLSRDINIYASNDAPALSAIEPAPVEFTEGDLPVTLTTNTTVEDLDSISVNSAQIEITSGYVQDEDYLLFVSQNGIAGSFSNGKLTLSGLASTQQYQDAIHSVTYENISEDPTPATRTISISVNDGSADSNVLTRALGVNEINDAPNFTAIEGTSSFEDLALTMSFANLKNLATTNDIDGQVRAFQITAVSSGSLFIGSGATTSQAYTAGGYDTITTADNMYWTPPANAIGPHNITLKAIDNDGLASATTQELQIEVVNVNDAPQGENRAISLVEGQSYDLQVADFGFSDPIDTNNMSAVIITKTPDFGSLTVDGTTINSGDLVTFSDIQAQNLSYVKTDLDSSNNDSFGFKVVDDGGVDNNGIDTDPTENFLLFDIDPRNDSPKLIVNPLEIFNGESAVIDSSTLEAWDIDDGPAGLTYEVTAVPQNGKLIFNGNEVAIGDLISDQSIRNNELVYVHDSSNPRKDTTDSFSMRLSDGGEDNSQPMEKDVMITVYKLQFAAAEAVAIAPEPEPEPETEPETETGVTETAEDNPQDLLIDLTSKSSFEEELIDETKESSAEIFNPDDLAPEQDGELLAFANNFNDKVLQHKTWKLQSQSYQATITNLSSDSGVALQTLFESAADHPMSRQSRMTDTFDERREDMQDAQSSEFTAATRTVTISSGLSIGYIIWLLRGGLLLSSVMSVMPAWRSFDPLPVLGSMGGADDGDTETLESMVEVDESAANDSAEDADGLSDASKSA